MPGKSVQDCGWEPRAQPFSAPIRFWPCARTPTGDNMRNDALGSWSWCPYCMKELFSSPSLWHLRISTELQPFYILLLVAQVSFSATLSWQNDPGRGSALPPPLQVGVRPNSHLKVSWQEITSTKVRAPNRVQILSFRVWLGGLRIITLSELPTGVRNVNFPKNPIGKFKFQPLRILSPCCPLRSLQRPLRVREEPRQRGSGASIKELQPGWGAYTAGPRHWM